MKSTQDEFPTELPTDSLVPLESILCTEELNRRPTRPPDYETENRALAALAQGLARRAAFYRDWPIRSSKPSNPTQLASVS